MDQTLGNRYGALLRETFAGFFILALGTPVVLGYFAYPSLLAVRLRRRPTSVRPCLIYTSGALHTDASKYFPPGGGEGEGGDGAGGGGPASRHVARRVPVLYAAPGGGRRARRAVSAGTIGFIH